MSREQSEIRVLKIQPAQFEWETSAEGFQYRRYTAPAVYAVMCGAEQRALIVRNRDGWRVCLPTEASKLVRVCSPVGLNSFRLVRKWALDYFGKRRRRNNVSSKLHRA